MKLLLENWRKYLNEEIMTLENWPRGYEIEITENPNHYTAYHIELFERTGRVGSCIVVHINEDDRDWRDAEDLGDDECNYEIFNDLYTLHVDVSDNQPRGFGPFLTDLALELAYNDNTWIIPARLVGGRGSEAIERVYDFYLDNRKEDVEAIDINLNCWEDYVNERVPNDTPESFLYLYRKKPIILNSELAKEVIKFT